MVASHADQGIFLLHNIPGPAGASFTLARRPASAGIWIFASAWAFGLAVHVHLVPCRTLLRSCRTLIPANAHQRPPLQHDVTTLAHAASSQAFVAAVPATPLKAAGEAATYTLRVSLVWTWTLPAPTWAVFGKNALQRLPSFHHVAGFADAAFSSADFWAPFWMWLFACGWAQ